VSDVPKPLSSFLHTQIYSSVVELQLVEDKIVSVHAASLCEPVQQDSIIVTDEFIIRIWTAEAPPTH